MKTVLSVQMLFYFFTALFMVQAEDSPIDDLKRPSRPEARDLQAPTSAETGIFNVLKQAFPGEILDPELQNLQELSEHPDYLHYLTEKYGSQAPFKTFQAFYETALPPKSRYFQFCQELFDIKNVDEINTDDIAIIYSFERLLQKQLIEKNYYAEEGKAKGVSALASIFSESSFSEWMKKRGLLTEDNVPDVMRLLNLSIYTVPYLISDATWINALFERDGTSEGILWLAIQDPLLFSRCLDHFSDASTFLLWVETDSHVRKSREEGPQK